MEDEKGRFWIFWRKYAGEIVYRVGGKVGLKFRVAVWVGERFGSFL